MSFPTLVASAGAAGSTTNGTSYTASIPDGSNVSGRRIIVTLAADGIPVWTWPSGWNVVTSSINPSNNGKIEIAYHDTDGTEGYPATGATISLTASTTEQFAHDARLISGHDPAIAPEASTAATGNSTAPNPTTVTPAGGSKDYLWLACAAWDNGAANCTAFPAGYGNTQSFNNGSTTGCGVGVGVRTNTAASEDPGAFTLDVAEQWSAFAISVAPAAAGAPVTMTPGVGDVTLDGFAPTFGLPVTMLPGVGDVTIDGFPPIFGSGAPVTMAPGVGDIALAGFAPTFGLPVTMLPGVGDLAVAGFAPTFGLPVTMAPGVGLVFIEGFAPTFDTGVVVVPPAQPAAGGFMRILYTEEAKRRRRKKRPEEVVIEVESLKGPQPLPEPVSRETRPLKGLPRAVVVELTEDDDEEDILFLMHLLAEL